MDPSRAYSGVFFSYLNTVKIQKIGDIQPTLPYTEYDFSEKIPRKHRRERARAHTCHTAAERDGGGTRV
jgi:hypothetical protein